MNKNVCTVEILPKGFILRDEEGVMITIQMVNPTTHQDWKSKEELRDYVMRTYPTCKINEPLAEKG